MSISTWLYVSALGIALATSGHAQDQGESTQGQTGQQYQPSYEPPLPFPVEIVEGQSATDARERSEEEARQREIADLNAQEGMNAATQSIKNATNDMRDYALYSTIIVGLCTLFLMWTLYETRSLNKSANAANKIMLDEQRPYLFASNVSTYNFSFDTGHHLWFSVSVAYRNSGRHPAKNAKILLVSSADLPDQRRVSSIARGESEKINGMTHVGLVPPEFEGKVNIQSSLHSPTLGGGLVVFLSIIIIYDHAGERKTSIHEFFVGAETGHPTDSSIQVEEITSGAAKFRTNQHGGEMT
jgi:hypothetical protein